MVKSTHVPLPLPLAAATVTATTTQCRDEIRMGTKINLALREDASAEDRLQAMFQVQDGDLCRTFRLAGLFRIDGSYGSEVVGHGVVALYPEIWLSLALQKLSSRGVLCAVCVQVCQYVVCMCVLCHLFGGAKHAQ